MPTTARSGPRRIPTIGICVVVALTATAIAAMPSPAQAASGAIAGTVPTAPSASAAAYYRPAVVAYRLDQPGSVVSATPAAGASFRLKVPAGLWLVQTPRWVNGQLTSALKAVPVAGGRTAMLRARDEAPAVRVASAAWTSSGLSEPEVTGGISALLAADLVNAVGNCTAGGGGRGMATVEDRDGPGFAQVLKEIKLGQSRYANAEFRAMAKRANSVLSAWAPTHRLVGTVSKSGSTLTATARVVNIKTGATEWTKTYTAPDTGDGFFSLFDAIPNDVVSALCKPEKSTGYFIGPVTGGFHKTSGQGIASNDDGSTMGTAEPADICDISKPFTLAAKATGGKQTFTPTSATGGTTTYQTTMPLTGFTEKGEGTYTLELSGDGGTLRTKVKGRLTIPGAGQSYETSGEQVFSLKPSSQCS